MKTYLLRNFITYIIISIFTTIFIAPRFINEYSETFYTLLFVASYVFLFVFMYGSLSSLISEIISKSGFLTINRLVIKSIIYCLAMLIFSLQSPKEFIIYGAISAVFYYLLEEFIRYKQKQPNTES